VCYVRRRWWFCCHHIYFASVSLCFSLAHSPKSWMSFMYVLYISILQCFVNRRLNHLCICSKLQFSRVQESGILVQPATISKKIHHSCTLTLRIKLQHPYVSPARGHSASCYCIVGDLWLQLRHSITATQRQLSYNNWHEHTEERNMRGSNNMQIRFPQVFIMQPADLCNKDIPVLIHAT
jgi:hypothetical protein